MTEHSIGQFIPALIQRDASVRKYATRLMGIEEESVTSFLLEALSSENERVRRPSAPTLLLFVETVSVELAVRVEV